MSDKNKNSNSDSEKKTEEQGSILEKLSPMLLTLEQSEQVGRRIVWALIFNILIGGMFLILYKVNKNKMLDRENTVCFPTEVDHEYPFVYSMRNSSVRNEIAKVYEFVRWYVHLDYDESLVNYSAVSNNKRYKNKLSDNRQLAVNLSAGREKAKNMTKFAESFQVAKQLDKIDSGWEFLVDCIDVVSRKIDSVYVVDVYGSVQLTRDSAKLKIPHENWGYKKVRYKILAGPKLMHEDEVTPINGWGLFVVDSESAVLTPDEAKESVMGCNFRRDVKKD